MSLANPSYNPPSEGERLATLAPGSQPPAPEPMARVMVQNGRRYELRVRQQPKRARMCGFGDKDRRPITPPPCVRLIITDTSTDKEVDCNDVDHGMFVLIVDLWSKDGSREVNLVRHTSAPTPTMGSSIPMSYGDSSPLAVDTSLGLDNDRRAFFPPPNQRDPMNPHMKTEFSPVGPYGEPTFPPQYQHQGAAQVQPPYSQPQQHSYAQDPYAHQHAQQSYAPPPQYQTPQNGYPGGPTPHSMYSAAPLHNIRTQIPPPNLGMQSAYGNAYDTSPSLPYRTQQERPATGMFTRNLIGSLAASAFRLTDQADFIGIWFVLQDLSVRTEGEFRLRFSFVNVGSSSSPPSSSHSLPPGQSANYINTGKSQVLASCFSDPFTVYSAKKFPGVVESTELSKVFAMQGIKIPIRKDGGVEGAGAGKRGGRAEYDEDD